MSQEIWDFDFKSGKPVLRANPMRHYFIKWKWITAIMFTILFCSLASLSGYVSSTYMMSIESWENIRTGWVLVWIFLCAVNGTLMMNYLSIKQRRIHTIFFIRLLSRIKK